LLTQIQLQLKIQELISKYALPSIAGYLEGMTEPQFHSYMKQQPDFVSKFRQANRLLWETLMRYAIPYKGKLYVNAELEANRLCWLIKNRRGWTVYKSEYLNFAWNISRLIQIVNS
jgi:hypothetical protein